MTAKDQSTLSANTVALEHGFEHEHKPGQQAIDCDIQPSSMPAFDHKDVNHKAWLTVAGASAALFVSFGWCNCIGLFQAYYQENQLQSYSSSAVSWITSMEFFFLLAGSPVAGRLFDSHGPRLPLAVGSFMHVFGLMMTSLATRYYEFMLSQSICSGIGTSLIMTPALSAPQTYFRNKRGLVGGLTVAGSSIGGVIFPFMVQYLVPEVGFPWTMRICAFLILALLIFANLTITSKLQHKPKRFSLMSYVRPLQETNFTILACTSFFMYWGMFVPFNEIVIAAQHYGMPPDLALTLVPIMNGASFFGRTIPNMVADKVGRFNVTTSMAILSGVLCVALWLPGHSIGANIAFAALFGISSGGLIGLGPVLVVEVSPISEVGTRMGVILAIASLGVLTAPPIGTYIAALSDGGYTYTALFAGINCFVAAIGLWAVRVRLQSWSLMVKV